MSKASKKPTSQQTQATALPSSDLRKRPSRVEDSHMRKITLYFVIGFCTFSMLSSLAAFLITKNLEAALIFQFPALMFFYRILCYLYPSSDPGSHPFIALVQTILKLKP